MTYISSRAKAQEAVDANNASADPNEEYRLVCMGRYYVIALFERDELIGYL